MYKKRFKIIPIILILIISIAFSGCLNASDDKQVIAEPAKSPTAEPSDEPYSERLDLLFMPKPALTQNAALSIDDTIIKFFEEKYNIIFEIINTSASDDERSYEEILSSYIVSGIIPDFMNIDVLNSGSDAYDKLIRSGVALNITNFMNKNINDYPMIQHYILSDPEIDFYRADDEDLYCLPNYKGSDGMVYLVRGDWVEKAGYELSDINTTDKFRELMEVFVEADYDKMGTDGFSTGTQRYLDPFFVGFTGSYMFKEIDGSYVDWYLLDEMREALVWFHEMYESKAFDREYLLHDGAVSKEKITTGKAGSIATDISNLPNLNKLLQENIKDGYLEPLPVEIQGINAPCRITDDNFSTAVIISTYFEEPERILDMGEFLFTDEGMEIISFGIKGEHYVLDGDIKIPNYKMYSEEGFRYNADGTTEGIQNYNEIRNIITEFDIVTTDNYSQYSVDWYYTLLSYSNNYRNPFADNGFTPTKRLSAFNAVKDKWIDYFISGKKTIKDKYWDRFIDEYLKAGAQAQMDFYNNK